MYAACPICGYKLCKGESGSDVDILCPRCGKLVRVVITETNTNCTPANAPKKAAKENDRKLYFRALRNRGRKRIGLTNGTEIKTVIRNLTLT